MGRNTYTVGKTKKNQVKYYHKNQDSDYYREGEVMSSRRGTQRPFTGNVLHLNLGSWCPGVCFIILRRTQLHVIRISVLMIFYNRKNLIYHFHLTFGNKIFYWYRLMSNT